MIPALIFFYIMGFCLTWGIVDVNYKWLKSYSNVEITFIAILWPLFFIKSILYGLFCVIFGSRGFLKAIHNLFTDWDY